jgi:geranylgeranyl diphosphate synthase, type I
VPTTRVIAGSDSSEQSTSRQAAEILDTTTILILPALRETVDGLPPSMRRIVGYHLGWCSREGRATGGHSGKVIRPAFTLLSARAAGGRAVDAVPGAVATELVHNFSLLHDDVMDGDTVRRHRPTAWTVFGVAEAILAGDCLLAAAMDLIASAPSPARTVGCQLLTTSLLQLCGGQSADMAFERRSDVGLGECIAMAEGKTGALLGCACALGAAFGGGPAEVIRAFDTFGRHLGLAFQLVDDLLGIWGDPAVTGKPVHADLIHRKKSLPVVAALTSGTAAGSELARYYGSVEPADPAQLAHLAALVEAAGGREWAVTQADHYLELALDQLQVLAGDPELRAQLRALATLVTTRSR